jgi:hypothetical protein
MFTLLAMSGEEEMTSGKGKLSKATLDCLN